MSTFRPQERLAGQPLLQFRERSRVQHVLGLEPSALSRHDAIEHELQFLEPMRIRIDHDLAAEPFRLPEVVVLEVEPVGPGIQLQGRAMLRGRLEYRAQIDVERISLSDRINEIMERLTEEGQITFADLLGDITDRRRIIYTFLAILELMKLRMVRAYQSGPFGTIRLFPTVEG